MLPTRTGTIALHVQAAKRLLGELEQQADVARRALGQKNGAEFFAAVDEREGILGELSQVVISLTQQQAAAEQSSEARSLLAEISQAATRALESHEQLQRQARLERDRLGVALQNTDRPDSVAFQYAAASNSPRPRSFSVTG